MEHDGWDDSAAPWIARQGADGDDARRLLLDPAMLARVDAGNFETVLDVGCGEGRFCRILSERGISTIGIDPTQDLLTRAQELHPEGDYRVGRAEKLEFPDASFDLVVSYLSLIDIPDFKAAIAEMTRVLKPGGTLLVTNLTSMNSAGMNIGWQMNKAGERTHWGFDRYGEERSEWVEWAGIRIKNWHRPLSAYMQAYLAEGLRLVFFDEPQPDASLKDEHIWINWRAPWFNTMEWRKPN